MPSTISASGSGLDIPTLVSQLVTATRTPVERRINTAGTAASAKLSAIGQVRSAMDNLQTSLRNVVRSADTTAFKTTVASGAGFTATATSSAVAGSYGVEVVRLATAQKLSSSAHEAGTTFGGGALDIAVGETSHHVPIGSTDTLSDIAAAINTVASGKGVTASVVTADDGQHLVFSATGPGTGNALTVTASGDAGLLALASGEGGNLTETVATDALVRVDGFTRTASGNTIDDLVPGVTLDLTQAKEGETYNLSVATDTSAIKANLTAFASAYNAANTMLRNSSAYNAETRSASALTGDSLVRNLQQQLRGQVSANIGQLRALGVSLNQGGVMSFSATDLDSAIAADPAAATAMFGGSGRYSSALTSLLDSNLNSTSGALTQRGNSLNTQIADLGQQLDDLDERMTRLSDQYTAQFTAMETMIVQMQSSASSLNGLLSQMSSG